MPNKMTGLDEIFKVAIEKVVDACCQKGVIIIPKAGLRNPILQAQYWRQSRTSSEITKKILDLKRDKAYFLAFCIDTVRPDPGPFVTNAISGLSWHQWGEAADFAWIVNNKVCWDLNHVHNNVNGYHVLAQAAKTAGLESGFFWTAFQDAGHIQLRKSGCPSSIYSMEEIDQIMYEKFGHLISQRITQ